ncbi:hypothetical protein [Bacillus toyonensis]|uniref:hypothetical protein n=1 Tax=Bacillus toyonensis TaxID=155322 RepID=UPI002867BC58|nr:hypothetical protein [Bacillus toyonensis]HDR7471923.1 hypothetical protein [Bacillus toyonensis]
MMSELVQFVMINLKNSGSEFDFESYTKKLLENIKKDLRTNDFNFFSSNTKTKKCSITIDDIYEFIISFTYIRSNTISQLKVEISGDDLNRLDSNLHNLKTQLKDLMLVEWEECLWLQDIQAEEFSDILYGKVHKVENALRRLINTILFYNLGGNWWETYMPTNLVQGYKKRDEQFKNRSHSFKNIHTSLMSIDTGDLISILTFKTHKVKEVNLFASPNTNNLGIQDFQYIMSDILNGQKLDIHKEKLTGILEDTLEVDKDFGKEFFEPWFSCNLDYFIGKWKGFCADRNHVAHNKLIDIKLFKKYRKNMEELLGIIIEAEKKFNNHLDSEMEQYLEKLEEQEVMQMMGDYEAELHYRRKIREEAAVEILEEDEILEKFKAIVSEAFENLQEMFYYRSDIEVEFKEQSLLNNEKSFEITNSYFDRTLHMATEVTIDSSECGVSTVNFILFYNNTPQTTFKITFTNGSSYFNDDQGTYMPDNEAELDIDDLEEIETEICCFMENFMPEIEEDNIASFPCEQCNKYSINLSEDNGFEIGTCLYCEHPNRVGECKQCGKTLNSSTDKVCDECWEEIKAD